MATPEWTVGATCHHARDAAVSRRRSGWRAAAFPTPGCARLTSRAGSPYEPRPAGADLVMGPTAHQRYPNGPSARATRRSHPERRHGKTAAGSEVSHDEGA